MTADYAISMLLTMETSGMLPKLEQVDIQMAGKMFPRVRERKQSDKWQHA